MWKSWLKTLGGLIVKYGPGLLQAILQAKAEKQAADAAAKANPVPGDIEK